MISVIIVNQGSTKIKNKRGKNVDRHDTSYEYEEEERAKIKFVKNYLVRKFGGGKEEG